MNQTTGRTFIERLRASSDTSENARRDAEIAILRVLLTEAENALADYIPTIEETGASLYYGRSVLKNIRAALGINPDDPERSE